MTIQTPSDWVDLIKRDPNEFNRRWQVIPRDQRTMLRGADLSGLDLRRAHIGQLDLTDAILSGAKLEGSGLVSCRLERTKLDGIEVDPRWLPVLAQIELLWRPDKSEWNQHKARERPPILTFVDFSESDLGDADLTHLNLLNARFDGCDLRRCKLGETRIDGASLRRARLDGIEASLLQLDGSDVSEARFDGAKLRSISLNKGRAENASFVSITIIVVAVHFNLLDTIAFGRAFIAAGAAIVGTVLICTAALLMALHDVDLGRPTRANAAEPTSDEEATVS